VVRPQSAITNQGADYDSAEALRHHQALTWGRCLLPIAIDANLLREKLGRLARAISELEANPRPAKYQVALLERLRAEHYRVRFGKRGASTEDW
jgi:hypothetical protein